MAVQDYLIMQQTDDGYVVFRKDADGNVLQAKFPDERAAFQGIAHPEPGMFKKQCES